jgi:hypothetical protein
LNWFGAGDEPETETVAGARADGAPAGTGAVGRDEAAVTVRPWLCGGDDGFVGGEGKAKFWCEVDTKFWREVGDVALVSVGGGR